MLRNGELYRRVWQPCLHATVGCSLPVGKGQVSDGGEINIPGNMLCCINLGLHMRKTSCELILVVFIEVFGVQFGPVC